jgi:hypothetical protein
MKSICKAIVYISNLGNLLKAKSVLTTTNKIWKEYVGVEVKFIAYSFLGGM